MSPASQVFHILKSLKLSLIQNSIPATKKISVSKALTLQYTDKPHYHAVNPCHAQPYKPIRVSQESDQAKPLHLSRNITAAGCKLNIRFSDRGGGASEKL